MTGCKVQVMKNNRSTSSGTFCTPVVKSNTAPSPKAWTSSDTRVTLIGVE